MTGEFTSTKISNRETLFSSVDIYSNFVVKTLKLKPINSNGNKDFLPFDQQAAFLNERACLQILAGRRVPKLIESDDSGHWLKMQNVGQSLRQWRKFAQGYKLDSQALLRLLADIAAALFQVHEAGIVHGDLRDENICVRLDDQNPWIVELLPEKLSTEFAQVSLIDFTFAVLKGNAIKPPPFDWSYNKNQWMSKRAKALSEDSWIQFANSNGMTLDEYIQLPIESRLELYVNTARSVTYPFASLDWTIDLFSFGELVDLLKTDFASRAPHEDNRIAFLNELVTECRRYDETIPSDGLYRSMQEVAQTLRRMANSEQIAAFAQPVSDVESPDSSVEELMPFGFGSTQPPDVATLLKLSALQKATLGRASAPRSVNSNESSGTAAPLGKVISNKATQPSAPSVESAPSPKVEPVSNKYRPTPDFEGYEGEEPPVLKSRLVDFLYSLAGAEKREINRLPDAASKAKYLSVGMMMIGVMFWAMWSAYHFYMQTVDNPDWVTTLKGIIVAIFWGLFVVVIEKAFISTVPTTIPEASDSSSDRAWFYIRYFGAIGVRLLIGLGIGTMLTLMSLTVIFKPEIDSAINSRTIAQILAADTLLLQRPDNVNAQQAVTSATTQRGRAAGEQQRATTELNNARTRQRNACQGDNRRQLNALLNRADITSAQVAERNRLQAIRNRCENASIATNAAVKTEGQARNRLDTAESNEQTSITNQQAVSAQIAQGQLATTLAEGRKLDSAKSLGRSLVGLGFLLQKDVTPTNSGSPITPITVSADYDRMQAAAIKWLILPLVMLFLGIELLVLITRLLGRPLVDAAVSYRDRSILKHLSTWYKEQHGP